MRGSILAYAENKGIVSGHDGNRYDFLRTDWSGTKEPAVGMEIDFTVDGSQHERGFCFSQGMLIRSATAAPWRIS